ncbi:MAG: hypothetical protein GY841_18680 [FCB group bacterium]|nr:hypothetical protein [FCB group bacterium]
MRKALSILLLALLVAGGCSKEKIKKPVSFESTYGVWAGPDCELVRTEKYSLLFWKDGSRVSSSLTAHEFTGDSIRFDMRGMAVMDTTDFLYALECKDLVLGGEVVGVVDNDSLIELSELTCFFEDIIDKYVLTSELDIIEEYRPDQNRLRIRLPDGTWRMMKRIESFASTKPYHPRKAKKNDIGECLQEWSLGVDIVQRHEGHVSGLTIGTNRHAYVFLIGGMVYCRAARIRSNDNGTVFAQNIRMMNNYREFTASMDENNLAKSEAAIYIIDSLFDPNLCVYADDGIYWSLKSFSDSLIILNGCGGADYSYKSVDTSSADRLEWFEFVSYDK